MSKLIIGWPNCWRHLTGKVEDPKEAWNRKDYNKIKRDLLSIPLVVQIISESCARCWLGSCCQRKGAYPKRVNVRVSKFKNLPSTLKLKAEPLINWWRKIKPRQFISAAIWLVTPHPASSPWNLLQQPTQGKIITFSLSDEWYWIKMEETGQNTQITTTFQQSLK